MPYGKCQKRIQRQEKYFLTGIVKEGFIDRVVSEVDFETTCKTSISWKEMGLATHLKRAQDFSPW